MVYVLYINWLIELCLLTVSSEGTNIYNMDGYLLHVGMVIIS